jgi:hypothetical protein
MKGKMFMKKFLAFLMLLTLIGCNSSIENKVKTIHFSYQKPQQIETIKEEIKLPNIFKSINEFLEESIKFIQWTLQERANLCFEGVYELKKEWKNEFCDSLLGDAKEDCLNQRKNIPNYIEEFCSILSYETLINNFDMLLVMAVIKNESNFGIIKKGDDGNYFVSQDVCEREIKKSNVKDLSSDGCRRENAHRITFVSSGNNICAYILEETNKHYRINTCLAGEAGVLQLITPNYYAGRIIPGTNGSTIPDVSTSERRKFINDNLLASIKIGIEELIRHRDIFPEHERDKFWKFIGSYNTGGRERHGQWLNYTIRVLKNYVLLCDNNLINEYFIEKCGDLKNFQYYWE